MQIQKPKQGYKIVKSPFGKYEEVPDEWKSMKLAEIVSDPISYGVLVPDSDPNGVPMIRSGELDAQGGMERNIIRISKNLEEKYKKTRLRGGELLVSLVGYTGQVTLVPSRFNGYNVSRALGVIRLKTDYDNRFFYYYLLSNSIQKKILNESIGSAQPVINLEKLRKLSILCPPLPEQQKIASILSNVDSLIYQIQKELDQIRKLKKGLLQSLLTKGFGHTKFKKVKWHFNQEISIPEKWDVVTLSEVCEKRKSNNVKSELYVGIENIESGQGCLLFRSNVNNFLIKVPFHKNDVLYSKLRPYLEKVWYADSDGFCSSDIYPLVANEKINGKFLFYILLSKQFLKFANATTAGGNIPKTRWNDIKMFKLFLPNMQEQEKIVSFIEHIDLQIIRIQPKKSDLMKLKKGLMQKLLTGQIRVKV